MTVSPGPILAACVAFGLVFGVSSPVSGQVDAALLTRAKARTGASSWPAPPYWYQPLS